ncbi:MAG: hypothetical protein KAJ20_02505, partial [Candidatus Aenigmarchaeota archaeon]|nr:hypothetical protein [Candidatus Aenigmarchaeota archaeon]
PGASETESSEETGPTEPESSKDESDSQVQPLKATIQANKTNTIVILLFMIIILSIIFNTIVYIDLFHRKY